jgi:transposase
MARPSKYPEELRERAVRMVAEFAPQYGSQWAAITAVAEKLGVGAPETVRTWVRRAEIDTGKRPGVTTAEAEEVKRLKREVAELRRANEILKSASAFFAAEFDRPNRYRSTTSRTTRWSSGSSRLPSAL